MNPFYNMIMSQQHQGMQGISPPSTLQISGIPQFTNPIQKMQYIMQAMNNPMQFVREHVRGIPEYAFNDLTGNSILQYMQQYGGVTQQDIQNAANQIPR